MGGFAKFKFGNLPARPKRVPWDRPSGQSGNLRLRPAQNSIIEEDMRRVKRWRSSEHFQRWLATYCLNSEKRMNRVHGHIGIPALWILLRTFTETKEIDGAIAVA
jgi:hypothetical protein